MVVINSRNLLPIQDLTSSVQYTVPVKNKGTSSLSSLCSTSFLQGLYRKQGIEIVRIHTMCIEMHVRGHYSQINYGFKHCHSRLSPIMQGCLAHDHNKGNFIRNKIS